MITRPLPASLSSLLGLLNGGASTAEWEGLLAEALADGRIDEEAAVALRRLHARLDEATKREGLLRLLYATATDLIAIRDEEAILKAIVRRTRALIGSDIAYLSLNDYERDESYIRVTDGATTAAFRNIRIPLGCGVLGAVATGSAPAQSRDYPNDTTKSHFPDSDAAVIGEGVKAIMGVPLWAEGRVIGALMVADRRVHDSSSADVALLESIGAHAAVALENARLFTDMTSTLTQLNDAQRQNLEHIRALENLTSLDQRLMETLAAEDILSSLHRLLTESLAAAVWILPAHGEPLRASEAHHDARAPQTRTAAQQSIAHRAPVDFAIDGRSYTLMSAVASDQHLGDLVIVGGLPEPRWAELERSALVLSAAMLFEHSLQDAQYRLQRELIDELLGPRTAITEALKQRARGFGITDDAPLIVRVTGVSDEQRQRALTSLRRRAPDRRAIVAIHDSYVCVIEPVREPASKAEAAADCNGRYMIDVLGLDRIQVNVGSSDPVTGLAQLPAAFTEARTIHNALAALERQGEAANRATLGTAGMLLGAVDSAFTQQLLSAQLGPLLDYDAKRGTDLTLTAWVYLDSDTSQAVAAPRLHIHPNTLRQRLERIDSILGADWRRGGRALDVHVALQIWRLRARTALPPTR